MLRINLLPASIAQRRLGKKLALGFACLLALCIALPLLYNAALASQVSQKRQDADAAVNGKAITDSLKQQAAVTTAQIAPITTKLTFTKSVFAYNNRLANLYYNLAKYTDTKILYTDAVYAGSTMTIKAYTPSIAEVGRYLQEIYQDPDFSSVTIDKIPGYPDGYYYKYYLGKTLVSVGTPPAGTNLPGSPTSGPGSGGPGSGGPGSSGFGGPPPGATGRGGPFNVGSGGPGGAGGGASQYGQAGQLQITGENVQGEPITPIETIVQRSITPLTLPRQIAEYTAQLDQKVYAKRIVKGFAFTVTVTLVNPPVAPVVPGPPPAGAAAPVGATLVGAAPGAAGAGG